MCIAGRPGGGGAGGRCGRDQLRRQGPGLVGPALKLVKVHQKPLDLAEELLGGDLLGLGLQQGDGAVVLWAAARGGVLRAQLEALVGGVGFVHYRQPAGDGLVDLGGGVRCRQQPVADQRLFPLVSGGVFGGPEGVQGL